MTALLIFERPARYRDRAVRYLVEVDGQPQSPRPQGNDTIEVPVEPGRHLVRVSIGQRRFFQAPVTIEGGTRPAADRPGTILRSGPATTFTRRGYHKAGGRDDSAPVEPDRGA